MLMAYPGYFSTFDFVAELPYSLIPVEQILDKLDLNMLGLH